MFIFFPDIDEDNLITESDVNTIIDRLTSIGDLSILNANDKKSIYNLVSNKDSCVRRVLYFFINVVIITILY